MDGNTRHSPWTKVALILKGNSHAFLISYTSVAERSPTNLPHVNTPVMCNANDNTALSIYSQNHQAWAPLIARPLYIYISYRLLSFPSLG